MTQTERTNDKKQTALIVMIDINHKPASSMLNYCFADVGTLYAKSVAFCQLLY